MVAEKMIVGASDNELNMEIARSMMENGTEDSISRMRR